MCHSKEGKDSELPCLGQHESEPRYASKEIEAQIRENNIRRPCLVLVKL